MTERERLIELLRNAEVEELETIKMNPFTYSSTDFTADYLLANGVVVLPCKVGDTIYYPFINRVIEYRVASIVIYKYSQRILVLGRSQYFELSDFGKTVFLTREEAEAKLKGGE